jgi:peptide/nickel transport system substrate-binding protein
VEVIDPHTVRFVLKEPFAPFLNYMASPAHSAILAKHVIDKSDPNKVMIGTGAFQVVSYRPNDTMLLKKNPNYWEKGLPYLDELEIRLIKDAPSRVAALRAKSVDYIWLMEPQLIQILMKEKGIQSATAATTGRARLFFNCTRAPFNNVKVRQALSSATDRKELIRVAVMGKAELSGAIPPAAGAFSYPAEKLPFYDYNVEKAKKLLAEAGYPDGFKTTFKVSSAHVIDQYVAQLIQRQWQKIGVTVQIIQEEWGTIIRDANERNYDMIHMTDIWRPDPDEYLSYDMDLKRRAGFTSPELDRLVVDGLVTLDLKKRQGIYHEIAVKVAEASPILYLFARPQRFEFWRNYVKGYIPTPQSSRIYFKQTWLDK